MMSSGFTKLERSRTAKLQNLNYFDQLDISALELIAREYIFPSAMFKMLKIRLYPPNEIDLRHMGLSIYP